MGTIESNQEKMDRLDEQMRDLFVERMETMKDIAEEKIDHDEVVYDAERENGIYERLMNQFDDVEFEKYYQKFLRCVLDVSKEYQKDLVMRSTYEE